MLKPPFSPQASCREAKNFMYQETEALNEEMFSRFQGKLASKPRNQAGTFLACVWGLYPQPSPHPYTPSSYTRHIVDALHLKDESSSNGRSAANHQALLFPKGRKHLIICFQLCQRKGTFPVLILFRSQWSLQWWGWGWQGGWATLSNSAP